MPATLEPIVYPTTKLDFPVAQTVRCNIELAILAELKAQGAEVSKNQITEINGQYVNWGVDTERQKSWGSNPTKFYVKVPDYSRHGQTKLFKQSKANGIDIKAVAAFLIQKAGCFAQRNAHDEAKESIGEIAKKYLDGVTEKYNLCWRHDLSYEATDTKATFSIKLDHLSKDDFERALELLHGAKLLQEKS